MNLRVGDDVNEYIRSSRVIKNFIHDTRLLLSDPRALQDRYDSHTVILTY